LADDDEVRAPIFILPLVAVALSGCIPWLKKPKPEAPEASLPSWLGRVVMVDTTHRFVLLDTGAPMTLAPGAKVITYRDKQLTSTLQVTPESRPPYIALEILEGEPALDDQAVLDESRPPPTPAPANPENRGEPGEEGL